MPDILERESLRVNRDGSAQLIRNVESTPEPTEHPDDKPRAMSEDFFPQNWKRQPISSSTHFEATLRDAAP